MKALFWRDTHHTIKGEMLMRTFESILDFIRARQFADHLVQTEVVAHAKFDVPPGGVRHFLRHRRRNCAGGLRRGLVVRHRGRVAPHPGGPGSLSRAP